MNIGGLRIWQDQKSIYQVDFLLIEQLLRLKGMVDDEDIREKARLGLLSL